MSDPKNKEPVSPMKILAGWTLYNRNPTVPPKIADEMYAEESDV